MKITYKILFLASTIFLAGAPVQAQDVVLRMPIQGDCTIPINSSAAVPVVIQPSGAIEISVDEAAPTPSCFGSQGGAALDVVLNVTPSVVESGSNVSVTWTVNGYVGGGTTTCTASGGTAGWRSDFAASSQSGSGFYALTVNPTNFVVSCSNAGDSEQQTVTVNGGGGGGGPDGFPAPPAFCNLDNQANRALPFSMIRFGQTITGNVNYEDAYGAWPGDSQSILHIPRGKFLALPFRATANPAFWQVLWSDHPGDGIGATVTISPCPGDFDLPTLNPLFCGVSSGATGASIVGKIGVNPGACDLVQDQIYYLNIENAVYNPFPDNRIEACNEPSFCNFLSIIFAL